MSSKQAESTELTFPDIPETQRRYGHISWNTDGYGGERFGGAYPTPDEAFVESFDGLELFSTPRVMEPGSIGWVYIVVHESESWDWAFTSQWGDPWVGNNVLVPGHLYHSSNVEAPYAAQSMEWTGTRGGTYIDQIGKGSEENLPYEVRIKVDIPEETAAKQHGLGGAKFNWNGYLNNRAMVPIVIGGQPKSAVDALAGADDEVSYGEVLHAIRLYNDDAQIAGYEVTFQDVIKLIGKFNK